MFPEASPRGTLRVSGKQNSLFPEGSVIKCLLLYGKANPSVLIGSFLVGILPYGPFPWKRSQTVYFLFSKTGKFKTSMARVPYNKLLTNLASLSRTGEYWPSVVFVPTSLRSVRTATTPGQYGPRARLVRGYSTVFNQRLLEVKDDYKRFPYSYKESV